MNEKENDIDKTLFYLSLGKLRIYGTGYSFYRFVDLIPGIRLNLNYVHSFEIDFSFLFWTLEVDFNWSPYEDLKKIK